MQFEGFEQFLSMGGYGGYVWPAYGLTVLVIGGLLAGSVFRHRKLATMLGRTERRQRRGGRQ